MFNRAWASDFLARLCQEVKDQYSEGRRREFYELFEARQTAREDNRKVTHEELGAPYGLDREAVKFRLEAVEKSMRVRLHAMLREEVGCSDDEVDEEVAQLFDAMEGDSRCSFEQLRPGGRCAVRGRSPGVGWSVATPRILRSGRDCPR